MVFCHFICGKRERKEGGKDGKWKAFYIFLSIYYVPVVMSNPLRYTYFGVTILELKSGFTIEAHEGDKTCTDTQVRSDRVLGPPDSKCTNFF